MVVLAGPGVAAAVRYRARAAKSADRWSARRSASVRRARVLAATGSAARSGSAAAIVAVRRRGSRCCGYYGSGSNCWRR